MVNRRGGARKRTNTTDPCYFCDAEFTGTMARWHAAIKVMSSKMDSVGFRWVSACSSCYWEVPPHGKRPGVRKRVPNEYITKWSEYVGY